jgi:peroxin-2
MRISYPSPRVSQLDAHILDSELTGLLKQQLVDIFLLHTAHWWTYNHHPELYTLLLNLVIFRLTVWRSGSLYGLALQNLKLADWRSGAVIGPAKRVALCAVLVGLYGWLRLQLYMYLQEHAQTAHDSSWRLRVWAAVMRHRDVVLGRANDVVRLVNLANFVLFLVNGQHVLVVHRLLGVSLVPVVTDLLKFNGDNVNFEFQNRQLAWNVMTEFLVFLLPLLKLKKLRRGFNRLRGAREQQPKAAPFAHLALSQCAICIEGARAAGRLVEGAFPVTNAHVTNCGHIYCYVCISTRFHMIEVAEGEAERCPRCAARLEWFRQFDDVDAGAVVVEYEEVEEWEEEMDEEEGKNGEKGMHEEKGKEGKEVNESTDEGESADEVDEEGADDAVAGDSEEDSYSEGEEFEEDEAFEL